MTTLGARARREIVYSRWFLSSETSTIFPCEVGDSSDDRWCKHDIGRNSDVRKSLETGRTIIEFYRLVDCSASRLHIDVCSRLRESIISYRRYRIRRASDDRPRTKIPLRVRLRKQIKSNRFRFFLTSRVLLSPSSCSFFATFVTKRFCAMEVMHRPKMIPIIMQYWYRMGSITIINVIQNHCNCYSNW